MSHRITLEPGKRYRVRMRGQRVAVQRIYKWPELRFGDIPCHVFTAKVAPDVSATWDQATQTLELSGKQVPSSEVSIPEYDLHEATLLSR